MKKLVDLNRGFKMFEEPPATGKGLQACSFPHGGTCETFIFRPFTAEKQMFHATPGSGNFCMWQPCSFSIGNDLFTTMFTAQMGRGKIQWGAFTVCVLVVYF